MWNAWIVICVHSLAVAVCAAEPIERYVLPLVPPYAIRFEPLSRHHQSPFQLVEQTSISGSLTIEEDVDRVAVKDKWIFGKSAGGYFAFDAAIGGDVRRYLTVEEWEAGLRRAGVDVQLGDLADPHTLAAAVPDVRLRPWRYRAMGATLGLTDDMWSLVGQVIGCIVAFLFGVLCDPNRSLGLMAVIIGWVTNVVAQVLIAGGGPGAFAGFFILPLFCWFAASLGRLLRLGSRLLRRPRPSVIASAQEPM